MAAMAYRAKPVVWRGGSVLAFQRSALGGTTCLSPASLLLLDSKDDRPFV